MPALEQDGAAKAGKEGPRLGRGWQFALATQTAERMLSGRHSSDWRQPRGNVVFFDGHAETVSCKDVWSDIAMGQEHLWYGYGKNYAKYWDPDGDGYHGTPKAQ